MTVRRRRRVTAPSLVTAFLLLTLTNLALRFLGFARAISLARTCAAGGSETADADAVVRQVCHRVELAGVFFPGRARCLEQSLVLYVLLRRRGVPAVLRLGVQPYPFNAHAWVELKGVPLNERAEKVSEFVPLPDFAI